MKRRHKFTILLLALVLVMSVVVIRGFVIGKQQQESEISTMAKASIPTITMKYQEERLNCIQGYAQRMTLVERVLTPLDEDNRLTIEIGETPHEIVAVEYVISHDGTAIEERRTEKLTRSGDVQKATLDLSKGVTTKEQYQLEILLVTDEEENFYYYTDVAHSEKLDPLEVIGFVEDFCTSTFSKKESDNIIPYIESDDTGDNTTLQHVDIHSSYDQITWGKLDVKMCSQPILNLLELNDTEAMVSLDYQVSAPEDEETNSYYLVHEYYRIRRSSYRMHLLEYDRELTQTFVGTKASFEGSAITLGILPQDVSYVNSEDGGFVAFVQAGELWLYEIKGNRLYRIFSLQDIEREDKRSFMQDYEIRILQVDDKGAVNFAVYGYCNRGTYEGKVCMQLCSYTKTSNTYEIRYVLEDTCSAQLFCQQIQKLIYLADNDFYYYYQNAVHHVNLGTGQETVLVENLDMQALTASDDGRRIAWVEDLDKAVTIYQMDLDTGEQMIINGQEGTYLRPIGYVNEDFAYGIAKKEAVKPGTSGELWFPMYSVVICDKKGTVIKDYTDETQLVVGGYTTKEMIHLNRVKPAAGGMGYLSGQAHQIVSSQETKNPRVTVGTTTNARKQKQMQLVFATSHAANVIHRYTGEEVVYPAMVQKKAEGSASQSGFYVYRKGKLAEYFIHSRDAMVYAEDNNGVVKSADLRTIVYARVPAERYQQEGLPVFDATILQQATEKGLVSLWQEKQPDASVYDATGIPLESTKQLVEDGWSVLVQTGAAEYYLLTGYTKDTFTLYQPVNGQTGILAAQQLDGLYQRYGRVCILCK